MKLTRLLALLFAFGLLAAACGDDSDDETVADGTNETETDDSSDEADDSADGDEDPADGDESDGGDEAAGGDGAAVDCANPPTKVDGTLTVATGETVFPPWMGAGEDDFDDPTTGTGYEGALVFALAEQLGFTADQVTFVRTPFDTVIAPGEKDWDFNIQQYSITAQRDEVVDFSDGYYNVEQAIIGASDSPAASATSLADLKPLRLGAAVGSTSLDYIENEIQPDSPAQVYDDNAAAKAAFDAGQVDAIVFDLPTAYFITAVEITDASIIGVLPRSGAVPEQLGMLFEEGSPLVPCVNEALAALVADGTLDGLEDEWLNQGGAVPTLAN